MKRRANKLLALLLCAAMTATPYASAVTVFAEDAEVVDFSDSWEAADSQDGSQFVTAEEATEDVYTDGSVAATDGADAFSDGEEFGFSSDVEETMDLVPMDVAPADMVVGKAYSVEVSVKNSLGDESGMYAMDKVIVTLQGDGTYMVRIHQGNEKKNVFIIAKDKNDTTYPAPWYSWNTDKTFTFSVKSLEDALYFSMAKMSNDQVTSFSNIQTLMFDVSKMQESEERAASASDVIILAQSEFADYSKVEEAIASIPADLSVYTDETAAAVTAAKNAIVRGYGKDKQAEVDKMAENLAAAVKALVLKDITVETTQLAVANAAKMFKVTNAVLKTTANGPVLQFTLGSTGYEYVFKGTYEEAVANGNNRDNWVKYEVVDGAYQFTIPVTAGETKIPLVSISKSRVEKFDQGTGTLEFAFLARQFVIDYEAKTLTTGDYDHTSSLQVDSTAKMFKVDSASLHTVGSPAANNYSETLELTMGSTSFDKVYVGNAGTADATDVESNALTIGQDKKVNLVVSKNESGGVNILNYLEKPVVVSFHSAKKNSWTSIKVFTISKNNGTLKIVDFAPATGVSLDVTEKELAEKQSFDLNATITPENTSDAIIWSSSNEKVATVKDGKVTAGNVGKAVITVKVGEYSAECQITVSHKEEVIPGKAATCTTTGWTEGKKCSQCGLILKSRKVIKATGHKEVVIPAVAATQGHTGLTEGKKCSVCGETLLAQKETPALPILVTKVSLSAKSSAKIAAGKKVQLVASVAPSNAENKAVTWKSSNKKVATVNANGLVTMKKNAGGKTVVITATAKDGSKVHGKIKLTCMKGTVKKITVSGKKTVKAGKSLTLKANVTASAKANKKVAWSSSNKKLATVSSKGVVKTFKGKKGTVKITVKALDGSGKKATFKIKIK